MALSVKDRVLGSLLGMAVGDAVGTTVEFMPPGSFEKVTDMQGGGKFSLQPGQVRGSEPGLAWRNMRKWLACQTKSGCE